MPPSASTAIIKTSSSQATIAPNPTQPFDAKTVINFATQRNVEATIWKWTGLSLYEDDRHKHGPRRIQVLWNDLNEWIDDAFI